MRMKKMAAVRLWRANRGDSSTWMCCKRNLPAFFGNTGLLFSRSPSYVTHPPPLRQCSKTCRQPERQPGTVTSTSNPPATNPPDIASSITEAPTTKQFYSSRSTATELPDLASRLFSLVSTAQYRHHGLRILVRQRTQRASFRQPSS